MSQSYSPISTTGEPFFVEFIHQILHKCPFTCSDRQHRNTCRNTFKMDT